MTSPQNRLFFRFSILSLGLMLLFALALAWVINNGLSHQITLIRAHGDAMMKGMVPDDAPFSIDNIQHFSHRLLGFIFDAVAAGSILVYAVLVTLVWRGGQAIQAPDAVVARSPDVAPREPARGALRRMMLLEFSGLSFVLMLLLSVGLVWLIGYGFSQQVGLLQAHGHAMMEGMHGMHGMQSMTDMDAPYSIPNIERNARWLAIKGFAAVAIGSLIAYAALLFLVRRGWRNMQAQELRWSA